MRSFSARLDGPASRLNVRDDQEPRLLAQIERFFGPIARADIRRAGDDRGVRVARRPVVRPGAAQDECVDRVDARARKQVIAQASRSVIGIEHEPKRMFWRPHVIAAGIALHLHAAVDLKICYIRPLEQLD